MPFTLFKKNSPSESLVLTEGEYRIVPKDRYHIRTTIRYDNDIIVKVLGQVPGKPNLFKGIILIQKFIDDKEVLVELKNGEIATEYLNTYSTIE